MDPSVIVSILSAVIAFVSMCISAVIALVSTCITIYALRSSKQRENLQNFYYQSALHSSLDILLATRRLRELYKEYPGTEFLDKYIEIMEVERQHAESLKDSKRMEFEKTSLHYQRKQLTQFWRGLALLIKNDLMPQKIVFEWWQREDVDIVKKVLIPIEDRLADFLQTSRLDPKLDVLYYLVKIQNKFY